MKRWALLVVAVAVGASKADLVATLGLPDQQVTTATGEIYQYKTCKQYNIGIGDGDSIAKTRCVKTLYTLTGDVVTGISKVRTR